MCMHRGLSPVVATRSSQVDLLWQGLQNFSTFVTKRRVILTLQYAECLGNVSTECGGGQAGGGGEGGEGAGQDPTYM